MEELRLWLPSLIATAALLWTVISAMRGARRSEVAGIDGRLSAAEKQLVEHDGRLAAQSQLLAGMPGRDDLHDVRLVLSELRGDMKEMRATQVAAAELHRRQEIVVDRVEQFLIQGKRP